jgi:uncharacterized membrane protein YdjX (TVP38/TMEM64 family)
VLLFARPKNKRVVWTAVIVLAVLAALAGVVVLATDITWTTFSEGWGRMIARIERLNAAAVVPLMALLPIAGFPIAVVYLVAGARFGPLLGGLIVAGATAVHMVGTYLIGRSMLRAPLQRWIERRHKHLPEVPADEHAAVAVIATLVPGLPYFVRNYLLVLAGVRLSILLWVCMPIYVARSYVTILLGNLSNDPTKMGLVVLLIFDALKIGICALVIWRLRVHHRKFHGHEHDHAADAPGQPNAAAK